ncbi:MAG TPA: polysaccharide deacetylase family protein [Candidatus Krumholzibacterium sp.]|nr:polysaccharide deacetylase family protein [Candidatus Krumholzibacterium sp.]
MSKRHALGSVLSLVPFEVNRNLRRLHRGRFLTVVTYHRVLDRSGDFLFDEDLISASTAQFRSHLDFMTRHFDVMEFRTLRKYMDRHGTVPPRGLIITFDDGYIDNYEVAWPILKEYGVPATMFATAGFIGEKRMFWWDKIAYMIKTGRRDRIEAGPPAPVSIDISSFPDRQAAARHVIKTVKHYREEDKEELIRTISRQLDVEIDEDSHRNTMTWEMLRELGDNGIEIGGHSVNHPIFSNIDEERLAGEVRGAKRMIEEKTGREVITFGSPGRGILTEEERAAFDRRLMAIIRDSGYSFSTMYKWGLAYENGFDPYKVPRLNIESHDSARMFAAKMAYPELIVY